MNVFLNGEPHITNSIDLAELLKEIDLADAVVATAVNGIFVPGSQRVNTQLQAGDQIEVLAPMQGG